MENVRNSVFTPKNLPWGKEVWGRGGEEVRGREEGAKQKELDWSPPSCLGAAGRQKNSAETKLFEVNKQKDQNGIEVSSKRRAQVK